MNTAALLANNLFSPPVIAFGIGLSAFWMRSDLKFPEQLYQSLTIYLLLGIGFKGGVALGTASPAELVLPLLATLVVGAVIPLAVFYGLRSAVRLSTENAAALAAHYGSVSAVTFMAGITFLNYRGVGYESFMPAIMAAMEIPAIAVALFLAKLHGKKSGVSLGRSLHEVFAGKTFVLLCGGLLAGLAAGADGPQLVGPFLIAPFYGVLMLFLLEMGMETGSRLKSAREAGGKLILFALLAPLIQGMFGLWAGWMIGLSQGGAIIFGILAASASYIAAPAAVRISLPEANPGYYVTCALGITFPFNLVVGIPFLYMTSNWLY